MSNWWKKSSTFTKVLIIGAAAIVLCGLAALVFFAISMLFGPDDIQEEVLPGQPPGSVIVVIPTPRPGRPYVVANTNVNIRSGPGTEYPQVGLMAHGLAAEVVGINPESSWWAIHFPAGPAGQGWVSASHVTAHNTDNVPVIQPPPVPQPTTAPPAPISGWRGEYFDNRNLAGDPVVVRDDETINFDWTGQQPAEGIPVENFSVRWTISHDLPAGTYRFSAWVDDGIRMWVDGRLVMDDWREGGARNLTTDVNLARGTHSAVIEYFQARDVALIQLEVGYLDQYAEWKAEYFDNPNVEGEPIVVRNETNISHDWGPNPPVPGLPADNYSARWSRRISVEEDGNYLVRADVEGGVRLWLDGVLLIDSWASEGYRGLEAQTGQIGRGDHDLRVDYFKATGNGRIQITASQIGEDGPPTARISGTTEAEVGQPVAFNANSSSVAPGSHLNTFVWDFGDGTAADGVDVMHAYTDPGTYEVRLTVTDDKGRDNTATHQIVISGEPSPPDQQPPSAAISAPAEAQVGQAVTFDASQSQGNNPLTGYAWQFGDGTAANAIRLEKVYDAPGQYNVLLTVSDSQGSEGSTNHQISVVPAAEPPTPEPEPTSPEPPEESSPSAVINAPAETLVNQPVMFNADQSQGSSSLTSYVWQFGDGTTADAVRLEKTYDAPGTYNVVLIVTDSQGLEGSATHQILVVPETALPTVEPEPGGQGPQASIGVSSDGVTELPVAGPVPVQVGQPIYFLATASSPGSNPIISYNWIFGDGEISEGEVVTHTYSVVGTYKVTLTIADQEGQSDIAEQSVQVLQ